MTNLSDVEKYIIEKLDRIDAKVHTIDKKLAYHLGVVVTIASLASVFINKFF